MKNFDYLFIFDDIIDGYSKVCVTKPTQSGLSRFDISIRDADIQSLNGNHLSSIQADLLDLATAIHFADKLAIPKKSRSIQIQLLLPLRHPEIFMQNEALLHDLLFWYTTDSWHFQFQSRKAKKRYSECSVSQLALSFTQEAVECALWSGGLDSLAGLQTRLLNNASENFVLIGTGSNNIMRGTQRRVFQTLSYLPHASGRLRFLHVPIHANYGDLYTYNQSHRARGIVFLLIGAVCALSAGYKKLHVYETGIGAINLPLPGGVGRDHSKAVHPISLIKVEQYISNVIKESFLIKNPFVFSTKAEMCISLKRSSHLIFATISCDRLHREKYIQCGFCSSCILRRQALLAAGIKDQTKYLIPHGRKLQERHLFYWKLMNQQVAILNDAINSSEPYYHLSMSYSNDLPDIVNCMTNRNDQNNSRVEQKIVELYGTYVREWQNSAIFMRDDLTYVRNPEQYLEGERWQQLKLIN